MLLLMMCFFHCVTQRISSPFLFRLLAQVEDANLKSLKNIQIAHSNNSPHGLAML